MPFDLRITLDEAGHLGLHGPIQNEMLCYYLLEKARQAVQEFHAKQAERLVQPASAVPLNLAKGNGHV